MGKDLLASWKTCTRCKLHEFRRNVVIGSGTLPCDILIIGEAPGRSEDLMGQPFIGQSGKLLHQALNQAMLIAKLTELPQIYITNIVACRPCDGSGAPNRVPTEVEANACWPRLSEIYKQATPAIVVLVGKSAEERLSRIFPEAHKVLHPAFLLRNGGAHAPGFPKYCRDWAEILTAFERLS